MPRGKLAFKESDVARAIRAAMKAGMEIGGVTITPAGNITVLPSRDPPPQGAPAGADPDAALDGELEAWRAEHGGG